MVNYDYCVKVGDFYLDDTGMLTSNQNAAIRFRTLVDAIDWCRENNYGGVPTFENFGVDNLGGVDFDGVDFDGVDFGGYH